MNRRFFTLNGGCHGNEEKDIFAIRLKKTETVGFIFCQHFAMHNNP